jgi:hypothetical protein
LIFTYEKVAFASPHVALSAKADCHDSAFIGFFPGEQADLGPKK